MESMEALESPRLRRDDVLSFRTPNVEHIPFFATFLLEMIPVMKCMRYGSLLNAVRIITALLMSIAGYFIYV